MNRDEAMAVHVARGASYIVLHSIAANVMMTLSFAVVARVITAAEMGSMAVLLMITGAARILVCVGMPTSVTKFIAEHMAMDDRQGAAGVFYQAIRANLAISLPIAAAILVLAPFLSTSLLGAPEKTVLIQILALDVIPSAGLLPTLNGAMLGLRRIKQLSTVNIAYTATRQSLIVALTLATRSLQGMVMAWVISETGVALALYAYVQSNLGPARFSFSLRRLSRFSFPLLLQDTTNYVYGWFDKAILLAYTSLDALGIYNATMTAFGVLANVPNAIATTLFPTYSSIQGRHGTENLENSIRTASRYVCFIAMPLSFGLAATARPALTLFVGEAYEQGVIPLVIVSLFFALTLVSTALVGLLVVLGETMLSLKITALNAAIGIGAAQLLLPHLGTTGAALARGTVMVTTLLTTIAVLRKRIRLGLDREAFWKSLVASSVMATAVAAIQMHYYSKYYLPVYVLIGGAIYLAILRILHGVKQADARLLTEYIGPRFEFISKPIEKLIGS